MHFILMLPDSKISLTLTDHQVMPEKGFGPEETVRAQLDALQNNDHPW